MALLKYVKLSIKCSTIYLQVSTIESVERICTLTRVKEATRVVRF